MTYLDHSLAALSRPQGNDVLRFVHEDSFGLHWLPLECEIFCSVDDGTILSNFKKQSLAFHLFCQTRKKYYPNNLNQILIAIFLALTAASLTQIYF